MLQNPHKIIELDVVVHRDDSSSTVEIKISTVDYPSLVQNKVMDLPETDSLFYAPDLSSLGEVLRFSISTDTINGRDVDEDTVVDYIGEPPQLHTLMMKHLILTSVQPAMQTNLKQLNITTVDTDVTLYSLLSTIVKYCPTIYSIYIDDVLFRDEDRVIPDSIEQLSSLISLRLSCCDIEGEISADTLNRMHRLRSINLDSNPRLTGYLRLDLKQLPRLNMLSVRNTNIIIPIEVMENINRRRSLPL